jgi:cob(I)alamin adenosyltransferase
MPAAVGDTSVAHGDIGMTESMRMTEAGLLEELEGERVRLMGRVDDLEAKVASLSGQLSASSGERDAISAKLEEAYAIIHKLENTVAERDNKVGGLEEAGQGRQGFEIEGGEESMGALLEREGDLEEAKACLDAAAKELEEAEDRVEALQAELYAAVEERDYLLVSVLDAAKPNAINWCQIGPCPLSSLALEFYHLLPLLLLNRSPLSQCLFSAVISMMITMVMIMIMTMAISPPG